MMHGKKKLKKKVIYLLATIIGMFLLSNYLIVHAMIEKHQLKNLAVESPTQAVTEEKKTYIKQTSKKNEQKKQAKTGTKKTIMIQNEQIKKNQKLEQDLKKAWLTIDQEDTIPISIAVLYKGKSFVYQTENAANFQTASIVKVSIASLLMHQKQGQTVPLTNQENNWLSQMIQYSDNDSATNLLSYSLGGYGKLANLYTDLAMENTTANTEAWGMTETTAQDQLKVLDAIFNESTYLNQSSREKISGLMNHVDEEQNWGVGSISDNTEIKNGWLPLSEGWIVNTIGNVPSNSPNNTQTYQLAILTKQNATFENGVQLVEKLAAKTHEIISASNA